MSVSLVYWQVNVKPYIARTKAGTKEADQQKETAASDQTGN